MTPPCATCLLRRAELCRAARRACPVLLPPPSPRVLYSQAVARQPLHPEPVFILGHPRTGTTHLHNLLSRDPAFAYATTFHAGG